MMRSLVLVLTVLVMHLIPGCGIPVDGVPGTDLSEIEYGATRANVENVLGMPIDGKTIDNWVLDTYEFDKGYGPSIIGFPIPVVVSQSSGQFVSRTGYVTIVFDQNDVVQKVYLNTTLQAAILKYERIKALTSNATQGDADAQWQLAVAGSGVVSPEERVLWQCNAAHQGHPEALWHQALDYWYGISPIAVDKVRGYMWTSIAVSFGVEDAASALEERANQLTLDQIAEAERLAAEWQRNPTPCEVEAEIAVAGE
jgi:hypothetical protein